MWTLACHAQCCPCRLILCETREQRPDSYPPVESGMFRADEQGGRGVRARVGVGNVVSVTNKVFPSLHGRVSTLVGHSMCTLAAILVNETMAL